MTGVPRPSTDPSSIEPALLLVPEQSEQRRSSSSPNSQVVDRVSLAGFLQLLEMERCSCSLRVFGSRGAGLVVFQSGEIAACVAAGLYGADALYELVTWGAPRLEVGPPLAVPDTLEPVSLQAILLEGARRSDERSRRGRATFPTDEEQPAAADSGSRLQLVPDAADVPPSLAAVLESLRAGATADLAVVEPGIDPITATLSIDACVRAMMRQRGAVASAVVDAESGMCMGYMATRGFSVEVAASAYADVVRAQLRAMRAVGIDERVGDISTTLDRQYHLVVPVPAESAFLYLVMDRALGNLALARRRLAALAGALVIDA